MERYERGLNHNYVIFSGMNDEIDDLTITMLRENTIEGLLPVNIIKNNDITEIAYEISNFQSMSSCYKQNRITSSQLLLFIKSICQILDILEGYYLESYGLCLSVDKIYWSEDYSQVFFCFDPTKQRIDDIELHQLTDFVLQRADYSDYKSVVYAYELYQAVREEHFSMQGVLKKFMELENSSYIVRNEESVVSDSVMEFSNSSIQEASAEPNNMSSILKDIATVLEEDDDWEREEPSGRLFNITKRKKNKKQKAKKNDLTDFEKMMDEDFFSSENEKVVPTTQTYATKRYRLDSVSKVSDSLLIDNYPYLVGSLSYAVDGCIEDSGISRFHARFDQSRGRVYLSDLNSASGTYLNGEHLNGSIQKEVKEGDRIRFGKMEYVLAQ